jgi:predicted metalloprotease
MQYVRGLLWGDETSSYNQHNGDDSPQSYETSKSTDRTWTDIFREQYAEYSVRNMAENIKKTDNTSWEAKI